MSSGSAALALGTVAGDLLDPEAIGLDAAFPALFLALLAPYLRSRRALVTAVTAGLITLVLLPVAPPGVPIVAASLAAQSGCADDLARDRARRRDAAVQGLRPGAAREARPAAAGGLGRRGARTGDARRARRRADGRRRPRAVLDERLVGVAAGGIAVWLRRRCSP